MGLASLAESDFYSGIYRVFHFGKAKHEMRQIAIWQTEKYLYQLGTFFENTFYVATNRLL